MKNLFLLVLCSLAGSAFASDLANLPRPFSVPEGKAVFSDFKTAAYQLDYDVPRKEILGSAEIVFETVQEGLPVFDSVVDPTSVNLDGEEVSARLTATPSGETKVRVILKKVAPGIHRLKIKLPIREYVEFTDADVKHAFWLGDLRDRDYLERFLPANLLFDRVAMELKVRITGTSKPHRVFTNGEVEALSDSEFRITYPETYNSSCLFYHLVPTDSVLTKSFSISSSDGRTIPAMVYMQQPGNKNTLKEFVSATRKIMKELEDDYGPFPHPALLIYTVPEGGMEYAGATATALYALGHELFHSYFARAVMPADGNSGWVDEGLASWRDSGYPSLTSLQGSSRMADHGEYNRVTDERAYGFGKDFFAYLNGKYGSLKPFLRDYVQRRSFQPFGMKDWIEAMNDFYGVDLAPEYKTYVFGRGELPKGLSMNHRVHREFTKKELLRLL